MLSEEEQASNGLRVINEILSTESQGYLQCTSYDKNPDWDKAPWSDNWGDSHGR